MVQKRKRYDKQFKIAAARVVLDGEMRAVDLARKLGIKDSTLRRWAQKYEEMGENAFPGNGSPKVNRDYEIVKLRKRIEELERWNAREVYRKPWSSWKTRLKSSGGPPSDCLLERIRDQLLGHAPEHRPAHDLPMERVDHGCEAGPSFARSDAGDVAHP